MIGFLKLLPVILGALPSLIQLAENAFGGKAPSQQAHQDAVVNLLKAVVSDVCKFIPNSSEEQFAIKICNDVAAAAVAAWYDVKNFLENQSSATA